MSGFIFFASRVQKSLFPFDFLSESKVSYVGLLVQHPFVYSDLLRKSIQIDDLVRKSYESTKNAPLNFLFLFDREKLDYDPTNAHG